MNSTHQDFRALAAALPLLFDADSARAALARQDAESLLARLAGRDLAAVEQVIRASGYQGAAAYASSPMGTSWRRLEPADLPRFSREPGGGTLVKLASFHPNGFVRAAAVRLLDEVSDGSELPFLLVRCNDWVPAVQSAAVAAVERRLLSSYAPHFIASVYLGERLIDQRRNKLDALHQRVQLLLRSPSASAVREAALGSTDRHVRRAAFLLSAEADAVDLRGLVLRALDSDDLGMRLWAVRMARVRLLGPALQEVLGQARADRSVPVRREALMGFLDDPSALRQSLLDPCKSLRELVRFYLRQQGPLDFAPIYRQEVMRLAVLGTQPGVGARLATAIAGLGETGSASDADSIELFTIDDRPRVRKAALLALGRLAGEGGQATLAAALSDPHPGVCQAALHALGGRLLLVGETAVWRAFGEQRSPQCRRYLVRALAYLPRWASVRCLLRASGDPDPAVAAEAQLRLLRWLAATNTTRPTSEELATIYALLGQTSLERLLRRDLLYVLQPWTPSAGR